MKAITHSSTTIVKLATLNVPTLTRDVYDVNNIGGAFRRSALAGVAPALMGTAPDRDWVLAKVTCASLNPVDAKYLYGDKLPHFLVPLFRSFIEGRVCGFDFCGEVVDAPLNSKYRKGDQIFGTMPPLAGSFAEYLRVPTDFINLKPASKSPAEASALPLVSLTALQLFEDNGLMPGMHVLVIGASGGTGHVAVQIAKLKGARVVGICSSRNADFVHSLGADEVICYDGSTDLLSALQQSISLHGRFQIILDTVTSNDAKDSSHKYFEKLTKPPHSVLAEDGKYVQLGGSYCDWFLAHIRRFFGVNLFPKNRELFWIRFPNSSESLFRISKFCDEGSLKVKIASEYPFTEEGVREAYAQQMSRRTVGKIVINIAEPNSSTTLNK